MVENTHSEDERKVEHIAEQALWSDIEVDDIRTVESGLHEGTVVLEVSSDSPSTNKNVFANWNLEPFIREGYIPTSVAASETGAMAWFEPVDVDIDLDA